MANVLEPSTEYKEGAVTNYVLTLEAKYRTPAWKPWRC